MKRLRIHPGVYDDIAEALAATRELFGGRQVALYAKLIITLLGRAICRALLS